MISYIGHKSNLAARLTKRIVMVNSEIISIFNVYKDSIFGIENDLRFWKGFLKVAIDNYSKFEEREIYTSIFGAYDIDYLSNAGYLKCHKEIFQISTPDLETKRQDFFNWIINLSVLRAYNSLEILLLRSIQKSYYSNFEDPLNGKKQSDKIQNEIRDFLIANSIKFETKNNEHLLQFLIKKSPKIDTFLSHKMNVDLNTTWLNFFFIISILRNIIAHQGMIIQPNLLNDIKSKAKDVFERYFSLKNNISGFQILSPIEKEFGNFLTYVNSFSLTMNKLIFNKDNLDFIGLE